jgi:two-component system, sensor histidine kinase
VPVARAAEQPVPTAAHADDTMVSAPAGHGRLALVVDDDAIVLIGLEEILVDEGYEVLSAMSAAEAVQLLKQAGRAPDIVVSDYRLRDGQVGTECIQHIRAFLGRAVPGVILTGETGPAAVSDIAAYGLGIAHKPITADQMHAAIERQIATVT